ncbi:MAG: cell division protein FtsL [Nitrospinae bacterium]|nr:cell division protein FtsL [Nitrospinota bacterium]MBL7020251.1 cell division protein FtsL [Nitrospinaceae bacterium]
MFDGARRLIKGRLHVSSKDFWMVISVSILFMFWALALVWPDIKKIKLAYEYQDLAKEHEDLSRENHLLKLERESLRSLSRVHLLAKNEVGMEEPDENRVTTIFLK